jgi:hypothetical protein
MKGKQTEHSGADGMTLLRLYNSASVSSNPAYRSMASALADDHRYRERDERAYKKRIS